MNKFFKLIVFVILTAFLTAGCGTTAKQAAKPAEGNGKSVKEQAIAAGFEIVDFDYVVEKTGIRKLKTVVLVDARPARKYEGATIPGSINVPDTKFKKFYPQFDKLKIAKSTEIITFCGGFKCIKSLKDAVMLKEKGFTNIKIYLAGMPDWNKQETYTEIGLKASKKAMGKAVFVDARPGRNFKKGTIATSISIPDTKFMKKGNRDKYLAMLPTDKKAAIIVYCGGYHCIKSHKVANILVKEYGYKNVKVMAAGLPGWKKAGFASKGSSAKKAASGMTAMTAIPMGSEEGSVSKKWFTANVIDPATRPSNVVVVDVRTPAEFDAGHVEGAINIPVDILYKDDDSGCATVGASIAKIKGDLIFMCASGGRAGEMYFGLLEDCKSPDAKRLHFLDAHVGYDSGKCVIN